MTKLGGVKCLRPHSVAGLSHGDTLYFYNYAEPNHSRPRVSCLGLGHPYENSREETRLLSRPSQLHLQC